MLRGTVSQSSVLSAIVRAAPGRRMIDFSPELKRHHCHVAASYAVAVTVLP